MKVIFLNRYFHPDISATSQMLSSLAFHLAAQGTEVHVITSRQRYDDPAAVLPLQEGINGVHVHRVRTSRFGRGTLAGRALDYGSFYLSASLRLLGLAGLGDVVVAKTDPPLISVPAAFVARLRGARLVNWLQDVFPEAAERMAIPTFFTGGILRGLRNHSLRQAAANVVLGERMAAVIRTISGPGTVNVIPNWADGDTLVPIDPSESVMRKAWGLEEKFVVAYSGNMGRAHEFDTILAAASAVRGDRRIAFLFIGGGFRRGTIEKQVNARSLENVYFQPYQAHSGLAQSLGAADVHLTALLPALEGLIVPSKIYGILAAGRPTLHIGDDEGEIGTLLKAAHAGFTVSIGDATELASRIQELAGKPELTARMGRNARTAFNTHFSQGIALDRWTQLLLEVSRGESFSPPEPARAVPASGRSTP